MIRKVFSVLKRYRKNKKIMEDFRSTFDQFNSLDTNKKLPNDWVDVHPQLNDATTETNFDSHYVYHPAWATRILKALGPAKHIDISSTLHFCTVLSAFMPVEFYDYRPAKLNLSNLFSGKADLTQLFFESNSIESLSCMHTVEHIGLGRYGDPLDPDGDLKSIRELKRVVAVNGSLLFVVPVGKPKIMFNAHRIYSPEIILNLFEGFMLNNFSLVLDNYDFVENADFALAAEQDYGCGCFWFTKNASS